MIDRKLLPVLTIVAILVLSVSCGSDDSAEPSTAPAQETVQLPPDHPPLQQGGSQSGVIPPPAGSGSGTTGMTWSAPAGWVETEPVSAMRKAQYRIPGDAGDAEMVVYYFGPKQGGDVDTNIQRWINEFAQPDGRPSDEVARIETPQVPGVSVKTVEVTGTYSGGATMLGGGEPLPDYMLLAAVAQGPDANWFFKLTGPEATVTPQREAFREMIGSLKVGG
jgi:hypothetical protein